MDSLKIPAAGKDIELSSNPVKLTPVETDREKMFVVFNNLIHNAIKFTGQNGRIVIGMRECTNSVAVSVRDNGPGIEETHLAHIFERYNSAGSPGKAGTGIGLSLARAFT